MEPRPLTPISSGIVLIVGAKPSNFDDEIRTHPRVIMWNSQQEHWTDKDLPTNVRAVFVTRWIGHAAFGKILEEARKRRITMFNPEGTGMIAKQVRELLSMTKETVHIDIPQQIHYDRKMLQVGKYNSKLHVLLPYVDWNKNNTENAKIMLAKTGELGITTTLMSLANFIGQQRKKITGKGLKNSHPVKKLEPVIKADKGLDVSVQMLDDAIQSLKDMRDFLVSTVEENKNLKLKLDRFRKMIEE